MSARRKTLYDVELTYELFDARFDPDIYRKSFRESGFNGCYDDIRKVYVRQCRSHIEGLVQSISRHSRTRAGEGWNCKLTAVISWTVGYCGKEVLKGVAKQNSELSAVVDGYFNRISNMPVRLHIHVLVDGEPGRTIAQWIGKYWGRRYGYVKKRKIAESELSTWYEEYVDSQCLGKVIRKIPSGLM